MEIAFESRSSKLMRAYLLCNDSLLSGCIPYATERRRNLP